MSRDIRLATSAVDVMTRFPKADTCSSVTELLVPSDMFPTDKPVQDIYDRFVEQLCNYLGIGTTSINLDKRFIEEKVLGGASLEDTLGDVRVSFSRPRALIADQLLKTTPRIHLYDCYHHHAGFRQEYRDRFGKEAFADPYIMYKW